MRSFVAIVAELAVGVAAAVGLAVAAYALIPAASVPSPAITPPAAIATMPSPSPAPTPTPGLTGTPAASAARSPSPFPLVGQAAPALVLPGLDGATIDLASFRGKAVWLVFGDTSCSPCRDEYPLMNGFALRYADAGLVVLAVHVKEDAATVRPFVASLGVTFPVAIDEDGSIAAAWKALDLPVHYWIDGDGIVRDAAVGVLGPDQMAASLGSILPGVTVAE